MSPQANGKPTAPHMANVYQSQKYLTIAYPVSTSMTDIDLK